MGRKCVFGSVDLALMLGIVPLLGMAIAQHQDKEKIMLEKFVPVDDVAERFSVSRHTVRQWLRQGKIPDDMYVKIGNTYRYNLKGIENTFLSTNKVEVSSDFVAGVSEVPQDEEANSEFEFGTDMLDEDV